MRETFTTIEKALFIKELEFFSHVGIEQAAEVAAHAEEVHYAPGDVIFEADNLSQHLYLVVEGNVVAERDGIVTTVFGPGRGFGDLSLSPGSFYGFTARTVEQTHVLRFAIDDFVETLHEHPEIAVGVVRALAIRLREAGEQLADLGRQLQDGHPPHEDDS
jgi:CRP/FNR family transcriptional regulator